MTIQEIASLINAQVVGSTQFEINNLNRIEFAKETEITFYADEKYRKHLEKSKASAVIVPDSLELEPLENQVFLKVPNPYVSFLELVVYFDNLNKFTKNGIHPTAVVESLANIPESCYIGPNCYIGEDVILGENTKIFANSAIHRNSKIGSNTIIYSNVSIYPQTIIGSNCIIHSGAVIGADGFGFIENNDKSYTKIPQIGNVVIEDDVEIGANTTIDRAFVGSTIIHRGVKLDNLIQIAHNDEIGENTAMAAQVGISGSVKIGKRVRLGGQVGVAGHLEIADDVILLAQSGVPSSIEKQGTYVGSPTREKILAFKIEAALNHLPEIYKDIKKIKQILNLE